ncbi:MAG: hypothetical protein AAGI38_08760 [Bacteroidota bacterium]
MSLQGIVKWLSLFTGLMIGVVTSIIGQDSGNSKPIPVNDSTFSTDAGRGALLLTRFHSYEEFAALVQIEYYSSGKKMDPATAKAKEVRLTHICGSRRVTSILKEGVSQNDFSKARDGGFWDKAELLFSAPYAVSNRQNLQRIYTLSRRLSAIYGEGDVAFYDLAERMRYKIRQEDFNTLATADFTEKGFINTFNHFVAQALMTSIFSEKLADFVADAHERKNMPELMSGNFTKIQKEDIYTGAVDNYLDMINNEWGQEQGKILKERYHLSEDTEWTPLLLANYLNDIQQYFSWAFEIGFNPFRPSDEVVIRFARKLNLVMGE